MPVFDASREALGGKDHFKRISAFFSKDQKKTEE
jgi:hypothetical protein